MASPWYEMLRRWLDLDADIAGRRVLEIACGRGGFSRWLAGQAHQPSQLVAADFAETAVRRASATARDTDGRRIGWLVCDIQALPFAAGVFDTVVSSETIEHVGHPARAVRELSRVLKPGGRLFLTTPNYLGVMGLYRGYLRLTGRRYTETGQPVNRFVTLPMTCAWVRRAGLVIEVRESAGHYLPWPGRPPLALGSPSRRRPLLNWLGLHSLVVARKPGA